MPSSLTIFILKSPKLSERHLKNASFPELDILTSLFGRKLATGKGQCYGSLCLWPWPPCVQPATKRPSGMSLELTGLAQSASLRRTWQRGSLGWGEKREKLRGPGYDCGPRLGNAILTQSSEDCKPSPSPAVLDPTAAAFYKAKNLTRRGW